MPASPSEPPRFPPGLRDVGHELDQLFTRLAHNSLSRESGGKLALDRSLLPQASRLTSAALNSAATSYEKVHLTFGASTATAGLSGTYAGTGAAAGATSLKLVIDTESVLSKSDSYLVFHVEDQAGTTVATFSGNARADEKIYLGNSIGLSVTFTSGTLNQGSIAKTNVSRVAATVVDMDAKFNDENLNARPRFENGRSVTAGSFTINGTRIDVAADDSVASVLRRITQTMPDIVVEYSEDQRIQLSTRDPSRKPIVVADDSSGFLEATNLAGAIAKPGYVAQDKERLGESTRFSGIRAGSFQVGGKSVTVDPLVDSLASVLARLSDAAPGATAYYDAKNDKVVVRGGEEEIVLSDDTSGFLAATGLPSGRPLAEREGMTLAPGLAARLERNLANHEADLVERTLAGPAFAALEEAASANAAGTARKARSAYGRDSDERGPEKKDGKDTQSARGAERPVRRVTTAFAAVSLGRSDDSVSARA